VSGAAGRGLAIVGASWVVAFGPGFFGHDPAGNPVYIGAEILWLSAVVVGSVLVARTIRARGVPSAPGRYWQAIIL
jgi:hypothetical protein